MIFDSIVVGAGVEGSSTAYQFAKKGYNTLLLEQFPLPHSRGSSHGQSRIIRFAYEQTYFAHMVVDALRMWKELEKETNAQIFKKTGVLVIQGPPYDQYRQYVKGIQAVDRPYETYQGAELMQKYPGALQYDRNVKGMLELDGGILRADKGLKSLQEQFVRYGGKLHDEERVTSIIPGDIVTVITNKGQYKTRRLALALGPWASEMLQTLGLNFPLEILRTNVCYWKEKQPGLYSKFPNFIDASYGKHIYGLPSSEYPGLMKILRINVCYWKEKQPGLYSKFPTFIDASDDDIYGLPSSEYPGLMKVCHHGGQPISSPEERDKCKNQEDIQRISRFIRRHFPGLECEPAIVETCLYTVTPDELPILGTHPQHSNVAFICGLSGTGFKHGPVIGQLMCELLTGRPLSHDISHFSYERFNKKPATHDTPAYGTVVGKRTIHTKSKL